jgi:nitrogen fixation NifU-like protein
VSFDVQTKMHFFLNGLNESLSSSFKYIEELALPPVKIHCSILAEDAIKAAVENYKSKHGEM